MLKAIKFIIIAIFSLTAIMSAHFVLAAAPDLGLSSGAAIGLGSADPKTVAVNIIRIALGFLGIIAIGLIIFGGFLWMTAAGSEDRIEKAKRLLVSAVIGLAIILSAFGIATYILNNLLAATGGGGGGGEVGAACSSRADVCQPDGSKCASGICGSDCFCQAVIVPPNPVVNCDGNAFNPGCDADNNLCLNSGFFCDASKNCTCQPMVGPGESCDGNPETKDVCEANSSCNPALNLFCDTENTCTCQPGAGPGESCNATTTAGICEADNNKCLNDLTCSADKCLCEENPVIKWLSPAGGLCANDINKECQSDADCPSSTCNLETPSAAPGNIITIGGAYFGSAAGKVFFFDGAGFNLEGVSPKDKNPNCDANWKDNQVIVVVPDGAKTGPLKIERIDKLSDTTDNGAGPKIKNLTINTIVKPGLCKLNPASGYLDDIINYNGLNFSGAEAKFGSYSAAILGKKSSFSGALSGSAGVPNISAGQTTTFVAGKGGENSNYLYFEKKSETDKGPYIVSFEPERGAPGQYITIRGHGFGNAKNKSAVYFGKKDSGVEASYDFPNICADSIWNNEQIIVKVPAALPNNNYILTIDLGNDLVIDTSKLSITNFVSDKNLPLAPAVCKISPILGQAETPVSLWGEYFDAFTGESRVIFSNKKEIFGGNIPFWNIDQEAADGIKPYRAEAKVPLGAITGGVKIAKGNPRIESNSLNFNIGNCLEASDPKAACGFGQICCSAGTPEAGRCQASEADCVSKVLNSVYEFDFNTGLGSTTIDLGSCIERSKLLGTCNNTCPNSPGSCSGFLGGLLSVDKCDYSCNDQAGCANNSCQYDKTLNRCKINNSVNCSLAAMVKDIHDKSVPAYCAEYKGAPRRAFNINPSDSCPANWLKTIIPGGGNLLKIIRKDLAGDGGAYYALGSLKAGRNYRLTGNYKTNGNSNFEIYLNFNATSSVPKGESNVRRQILSASADWNSFSLSLVAVENSAGKNNYAVFGSKITALGQETYFKDLILTEIDSNNIETDVTPWNKKLADLSGWKAADNSGLEIAAGFSGSQTGGSVCVNPASSCVLCNPEFVCTANDPSGKSETGICAKAEEACPSGSICAADNTCQKTAEESCQCCCRKANANEDCCAGLTCEGACGSDKTEDPAKNTNTYGSCGGCKKPGGDQASWDEACNCAGTNGKYCDIGDPDFPSGVCRDCAELSSNGDCTNHSGTCCVDNTKKNICTARRFGGSAGDILDLVWNNNTAFCGYYECDANQPLCAANNPVATSTGSIFKTWSDCAKGCGAVTSGFGLSCAGEETPANPTPNTCNKDICQSPTKVYSCLLDDGKEGFFDKLNDKSCGTCCCDPKNDRCFDLGANLRCQPDVGPCDGSGRGLCCGCSANKECDSTATGLVGCGSDSCCRARPDVESTKPANKQENVCTNAAIEISFNQEMNSASFSGNVFVVGEYDGLCPEGTVFLAAAGFEAPKENLLAKIIFSAKGFVKDILGRNTLADEPSADKKYCAIAGAVTGENVGEKTKLIFAPRKILDANLKYFVIVRGDFKADNSVGVLSSWGIGLNAKSSPTDSHALFNGISYSGAAAAHGNSYIFSFKTLPDQNGSKGICEIDHAAIDPASYLFQTGENDLNENDTDKNNETFDDVKDSDKVFVAKALSSANQRLVPVAGYAWNWEWKIADSNVAGIISVKDAPFKLTDDSQLIRAQAKINDKKTKASAKIVLTDKAYSGKGDGVLAEADIFVFLCANPWPAIKTDGTWAPWLDRPDNCAAFGGTFCNNFNYEIYYCRDQGEKGTADDLPPISSDVTRGTANGILKESFFFRTRPPEINSANLQGTLLPQGGAVDFNWSEIKDPKGIEAVSEYKLYSGEASGKYLLEAKIIKADAAPYKTGQPYRLEGLDKNKTYYFALTAIYKNGEESKYSNEVKISPVDKKPPAKPLGLRAESLKEKIILPLDLDYSASSTLIGFSLPGGKDNDKLARKIASFQAEYRLNNGKPRTAPIIFFEDVLQNKNIALSNLIIGMSYYFKLNAFSSGGAIATTSKEFKFVLSENGLNVPEEPYISAIVDSGEIKVSWTPNSDDAAGYRIYWGANPGAYGDKIEITDPKTSSASFKYSILLNRLFITIAAFDSSNNESEKADEITINL